MAGVFNISGSALLAERQRLDLIASNIANADSTSSANGKPYRARFAVLSEQPVGNVGNGDPSGAEGVRVSQVVQGNAPFRRIYDPGNPKANAQGYVTASNVSLIRQMTDMIDATQSYRANLAMLQQNEALDSAMISDL